MQIDVFVGVGSKNTQDEGCTDFTYTGDDPCM